MKTIACVKEYESSVSNVKDITSIHVNESKNEECATELDSTLLAAKLFLELCRR